MMLSFTSPKKKWDSSDFHKVTRIAAVVPHWHICSHKLTECIVSFILQGYHFIRQIVPLFTRTVSRDSRWLSDLRYYSLPWVGVHAFWIGELQLILRFYSPCLKKVLKFFPSAHSHASRLTNTLFISRRISAGGFFCPFWNRRIGNFRPNLLDISYRKCIQFM
jgi:hypothetical protein